MKRSSAMLLGNALVVLLVLSAAAFVDGMKQSLSINPDSKNVILLATGSEESIERSEIPSTTPGIIKASIPGIETMGDIPCVSPEILSALVLQSEKDSNEELRAVVRGVQSEAFLVHQRVEITEGRAPRPGSNEFLAGSLAAEKLGVAEERLGLGNMLWFEGIPWEIVGRFQAHGTVMESELWTSLTDIQIATKREGISSVVLTLGEAEYADIDAFTKMRIDLELSAVREAEYYASILRFFQPVQIMIWVTAILISLAGVLGGLNTLYSALTARVRELAMLQSLGYSRRSILLSLLQESFIVAALGVLLAVAVAHLLLDGVSVSYSMGVFQLALNERVIAMGSLAGLFVGIIGCLPPAWKCLRMPIPEALKAI